MLRFQIWLTKVILEHPNPMNKKVETSVALVKDLLEENIDGHVIYFYNEATIITKPNKEEKT